MGLTVFLIVFITICSINCIYLLLLLPFTFKKNNAEHATTVAPLSVLIYIKNDAAVLEDFLKRIIQLEDFQKHQFLFVNHSSYDDSEEILEQFEIKYSNAKLVNVENKEAFWGSKRYAITLGIKQASNEKLIFISPNTFFENNEWLTNTSHALHNDFLIGYNGFTKEKGFFNILTRFYTLSQEMYHLGLGSLGKSIILNDNNIGYTSSLFFEHNGFNKRIKQYVGTQSLLYQDIGSTSTTHISKDLNIREAYSWTRWKQHQLNRNQTFAKSSIMTKLLWILFNSSQYLFWALFILGCIFFPNPILFIAASVRLILNTIVFIKNGKDFNEKECLFFYPFIELVSLLLGVYLLLSHLSTKKN